jgi:hypothetical protein
MAPFGNLQESDVLVSSHPQREMLQVHEHHIRNDKHTSCHPQQSSFPAGWRLQRMYPPLCFMMSPAAPGRAFLGHAQA